MEPLTCHPIGFMRCPRERKFLLPHQPGDSEQAGGVVELLAGRNFETALHDLDGFSRIWLVWWFHRHRDWRPRVLPPHGRAGRRGLFATRSPHRPNPIGLSAVRLLGVDGLRLYVGDHDLLDGTPILDIKPYMSRFDAFPHERQGWFEQVDRSRGYRVTCEPLAARQLEWLQDRLGPTLAARLKDLLEVDPFPHRTRRILRHGPGYRVSCGDWRVFYRIEGTEVVLERLASRFTREPPDEVHRDFLGAAWS